MSTNTKHTPGPWEAILPDSTFRNWAVHSEDHHICALGIDPPVDEEEANARLIAAAPELLEALQEAVACGIIPVSSAKEGGANKYARHVQVADMCRAAIAKATGHTS